VIQKGAFATPQRTSRRAPFLSRVGRSQDQLQSTKMRRCLPQRRCWHGAEQWLGLEQRC